MPNSILSAFYRITVLAVILALVAIAWTLLGRTPPTAPPMGAPPAGAELAEMAAEIRPTIAALDRIRRETGAYPAKVGDVTGRLPPSVLADATNAGDVDALSLDIGHGIVWVYARDEDGQSYELTRHLADGGSLVATSDHGTIAWSFAASDDEDASPVTLGVPN
jgi:hypothetical protein